MYFEHIGLNLNYLHRDSNVNGISIMCFYNYIQGPLDIPTPRCYDMPIFRHLSEHRDVGTMGCRNIGMSEHRYVGTIGCRNIGMSEQCYAPVHLFMMSFPYSAVIDAHIGAGVPISNYPPKLLGLPPVMLTTGGSLKTISSYPPGVG